MSQQDTSKNKIITYLAIAMGVAFMIFTINLWSRFSKKDVPAKTDATLFKSDNNEGESGNETIGDYEQQLNKTAADINKSCPIMIDMETRLDNVMAFILNNEFQYNYTLINTEKDFVDVKEMENVMRPMVLGAMKTSADLKVFRDNKTTLLYHYSDRNGMPLFKLTFPASEYGY